LIQQIRRDHRFFASRHSGTPSYPLCPPTHGNPDSPRKVGEIKAPELLAALRTVEKRGHYETARRLRSTSGQVFRHAIATGRAERDVSADLRGALIVPKVTHRAAITTSKQAGALLQAIDGYSRYPVTHAALRLAPYVFVRPGELQQAEWSEFDFTRNIWTIAADKTKKRVAHRAPRTACRSAVKCSPSWKRCARSPAKAAISSPPKASATGQCAKTRSIFHCGEWVSTAPL
jgi:hypothetical protein